MNTACLPKRRDTLAMLEMHKAGKSYREIGKEFGISRQAAHRRVRSVICTHPTDLPRVQCEVVQCMLANPEAVISVYGARHPVSLMGDRLSPATLEALKRKGVLKYLGDGQYTLSDTWRSHGKNGE
jgi:hypothetical protein